MFQRVYILLLGRCAYSLLTSKTEHLVLRSEEPSIQDEPLDQHAILFSSRHSRWTYVELFSHLAQREHNVLARGL